MRHTKLLLLIAVCGCTQSTPVEPDRPARRPPTRFEIEDAEVVDVVNRWFKSRQEHRPSNLWSPKSLYAEKDEDECGQKCKKVAGILVIAEYSGDDGKPISNEVGIRLALLPNDFWVVNSALK